MCENDAAIQMDEGRHALRHDRHVEPAAAEIVGFELHRRAMLEFDSGCIQHESCVLPANSDAKEHSNLSVKLCSRNGQAVKVSIRWMTLVLDIADIRHDETCF